MVTTIHCIYVTYRVLVEEVSRCGRLAMRGERSSACCAGADGRADTALLPTNTRQPV